MQKMYKIPPVSFSESVLNTLKEQMTGEMRFLPRANFENFDLL